MLAVNKYVSELLVQRYFDLERIRNELEDAIQLGSNESVSNIRTTLDRMQQDQVNQFLELRGTVTEFGQRLQHFERIRPAKQLRLKRHHGKVVIWSKEGGLIKRLRFNNGKPIEIELK